MQFWNDGFGQNRKPWRCGDSWRKLSARRELSARMDQLELRRPGIGG
jgi:hypothetical protein